jgi:CheY-like chemotaxis protein
MSNFTILIADDERGIRQFLKQELLAEGFDVMLAEDGLGAVQVLDRFVVDLVILDQHMPLSNGLETARRIRQIHPALPIVLFTADVCLENCQTPEIDAAVMKSADLGALKSVVAKLLSPEAAAAHTPHTPLASTWPNVEAKCGG